MLLNERVGVSAFTPALSVLVSVLVLLLGRVARSSVVALALLFPLPVAHARVVVVSGSCCCCSGGGSGSSSLLGRLALSLALASLLSVALLLSPQLAHADALPTCLLQLAQERDAEGEKRGRGQCWLSGWSCSPAGDSPAGVVGQHGPRHAEQVIHVRDAVTRCKWWHLSEAGPPMQRTNSIIHAPDDCEGDIHAAGDDMAPVPGALHPRPVLSAECLAVRMSFARCQTHRGVPQSTAQWQYRVRYGAAHRVHKAQVWPNVVSADSNVEHVEDQDRDVVSAHQVHAAHCAGANEEVSQSAVLCSGGVGSVL